MDYLDRNTDFGDPRIASALDELSLWSSRFGGLIFENLELQGGLTILDLGCGTGFPLFELAHVHGSSCRLVGVDVWKEALGRASRKLSVHGLHYVHLVRADGARLPFRDGAFDLVVSNVGVNNFKDAPAALRECHRVSATGGRLVLTTNVKGHMQEFYEAFRQTLVDLGHASYLERLAANEDHRGTVESIRTRVQAAGFEVSRTIEDCFHMAYLDGSTLLRHSLTRIGFLEGWRGVVEPAIERRVFLALEEKLNDLARAAGQLRMTVPMLYLEARRF